MFDRLFPLLETARIKGASYADVRLIHTRSEDLTVRNEAISRLDQAETLGYGVRVLVNGAWGFASCDEMTSEAMQRTAALAVQIGKASSTANRTPVRLAPEEPHVDIWQMPFVIDPFSVSLDDKLDLLFSTVKILRKDPRIKVGRADLVIREEQQWFVNSEGSRIEQILLSTGGGMQVMAVDEHDVQVRSYPCSFRGQHKGMGYELIHALDFLGNAPRVRDEGLALLTAPVCPEGTRDVILSADQLALQIHESVGHPTELDRVLGMEANYAGTSFATTDKLGHFRYGSPQVTLMADSTVPTGLATAGYDDDGVAAQRWPIVQEGILRGYATNRELADEIHEPRSRGANRADGFSNIPIVRIPNLSLMPGSWELNDLLADSDGALLLESNKSWSIDQRRLNFQFGCETAWEIQGGKRGTLYKNASYQGVTPQFWNSCDAVCNHRYWDLWGVINCGKGQPGQRAEMSHGVSPARFRKAAVGIR